MAKVIEYDVTGVEESTGGTGVKIKPGVHPARIAKATQRTEKRNGEPANDIEIALDVGDEYDWVFTYVGLGEASDWKLAELVRAVGLKDKGKLDVDKLVDKIIRVKINPGTYGEEYSPNAGRLMKAQPGDEDLIGQQVSESSSRAAGPDEDDAEPEAEGEVKLVYRENQPDPEAPDEILGSYDEWPEEDLLAEVEERGLTLAGGRGAKKAKAIKALRDDDEAAASDDTPAAGGDDPQDDYDEWDLDRLKQEWEDRQMGDLPKISGRNADGRLRTKLIEELRADDEANPFEG